VAKLKKIKSIGYIDKDRGWKKIKSQLIALRNGRAVAVGIQGDDASEDHEGMTNAQLGAIHEFGLGVPERSFIRSTFDENNAFQTRMDVLAKVALSGGTAKGQLIIVGEQARTAILRKIKSHIPPPLAESTVAHKKGETTPLIDTGQLWNSISYEIVDPKTSRAIG